MRPALTLLVTPVTQGVARNFTGSVQPRYQTQLGFQTTGRMTSRDLNVGDPVSKGQQLATLDPTLPRLALVSLEGRPCQFAGGSRQRRSPTYRRQQKLIKTGSVSQAQVDAAVASRDTAQAKVQQAQASLQKAQEQFGYTTLKSGYHGVIASWSAEFGQIVSTAQTVVIAVTIVLVIFNYWFFEKTMLGKKLQATSQDKEMASLLGISVSTMIMITFIYSAVLGGLAGILVAPVLFVSIQMGSTIALKAFAATIIGGFGDVTGAIIGGLSLGIIETFGAAYISVPYKDAFAFLVLVAFLVFRPQGIFGERVAEKA